MAYQILLQGSCIELLPASLAPEIDHLITDLPYSPHVHASGVSCAKGGGAEERDLGFAPLDDVLRNHAAAWAAGVRRWTILYSDVESAEDLMRACEAAGAERIRHLAWVRWSMPQLSADRPPQGFELLPTLHGQDIGPRGGRRPRSKRWYGPGWLTHLDHTCMRGKAKHPTQKPLDQSLDLVSWYTDPGETVADLTAGHAGLGVACAILGRSYLGGELDPSHAAIGQARIAAAQRGEVVNKVDYRHIVRWQEATRAGIAKAREIQEAEEARAERWLAKHPGKPLPKRLKPSVQNPRYRARAEDSLQRVEAWLQR